MIDGSAIGFWRTVGLLLKASRRRSAGRRRRQQELLNNRSGKNATNWSAFAGLISVVFGLALNGIAAILVITAVLAGERLDFAREGRVVVSSEFLTDVQEVEQTRWSSPALRTDALKNSLSQEASRIVKAHGGNEAEVEQRLRSLVAASGSSRLVSTDNVDFGMSALGRSRGAAALLGSLALVWWLAMLVCQGEGLELDLQRRRHPMWEWLLSHPVGPGAVFFAEMLSPILANPTYWTAPLFAGILYGVAYDPASGFIAAGLVGVPLTLAAGCLGKALEIGAMLRLSPRNRGAVIGIIGWFGYASMVAMFFCIRGLPGIAQALAIEINFAASAPWPVLGLFLGFGVDGDLSFARGVVFCWAVSAVLVVAAVMFSARSVRNGLSGAFGADILPGRPARVARFGRQPLFRKEYLWFVRDRSAIVQTILIPLTVAGYQLFNLRRALHYAVESWNFLCGAAIFMGTYFLLVLGPKSLTSEGSALWLALTWPRGLEGVLKAKAWLWSMIATGLVTLVLLVACWVFPHDAWKIALVAVGWFVFARSMAEKSVTLVTVVSESGEVQKIPAGRQWAVQLGMLTFAIGVCTQQWNLAIVGIVYSWITAAAMWENLRARLPYLYDPWSETLPEPPTLMHAMVAISILIECASVMTALVVGFGGRENLPLAQSLGYAICAVGTSIGVSLFLSNRGVSPARIWCWRDDEPEPDARASLVTWVHRYVAADRRDMGWLLAGLGGGLLLGIMAHVYVAAISLVPAIAEIIRESERTMQSIPGLRASYALMAIGFAPFAEEYLFRGLVFRTLDRQWGGWKAVAGAAMFFAIYHPPLAWIPVAALGACNCLLFKRSQRIAPAVVLHMGYNAVVVLWG